MKLRHIFGGLALALLACAPAYAASLVVLPRQLVVDANGDVRVGAKLNTYQCGTTTPLTTYTTPAVSVAHANPVLSVSTGLFPAIYTAAHVTCIKLVLTDSADVAIYTEDNIPAIDASGYLPLDIRRYGAEADGSDDDYAELAAVSSLNLLFPVGTTTVVSDNLTLSGNVVFERGATIKPASGKWIKFTGRVEESGQSILNSVAAGNVVLTNDPQYSYKDSTYAVVAAPSALNEFATIQAAFNAVPRFIGHAITVTVADATWSETPELSNKHLIESSPAELFITGDVATPANVIVNGIVIRDVTGYLAPKIDGFKFSGGLGLTGGNESVVALLNVQRASFDNTVIDGTGIGASPPVDAGLLAYASRVDLQDTTITNARSRHRPKHGGEINVVNGAIQSGTGVTFPKGEGNGWVNEIKMLGYNSATSSPLPDTGNAGKSMVQGIAYDQFTGALHGPGFFLSSASTIEDYFQSITGYTNSSTGDGTIATGTDGLLATTTTGLVNFFLDRDSLLAPSHLQRPIFFLVTIKINTLPSGETIRVGTGWSVPGAGDFIGFKLTSNSIDGIVRINGTEVATNMLTGAVTGTHRLGFMYSPQTSDTEVESTPTNHAAFFRNDANSTVYQTMSGPFADAGSMHQRFTLYIDGVAAAVSVNILGYKYVKI